MKKVLQNLKNESAFTLVEIIVAMMVFSIASLLFMQVFNMVSSTTMRVESQRLAQQDARYAVEQISREVRRGWGFALADSGKTINYTIKDDASNPLNCSMKYVANTDDSGKLIKSCPGLSDEQLTSDVVSVKDINFVINEQASQYPIIRIYMKLTRKDYPRFQKEIEVSTEVTSRMRDEELNSRD